MALSTRRSRRTAAAPANNDINARISTTEATATAQDASRLCGSDKQPSNAAMDNNNNNSGGNNECSSACVTPTSAQTSDARSASATEGAALRLTGAAVPGGSHKTKNKRLRSSKSNAATRTRNKSTRSTRAADAATAATAAAAAAASVTSNDSSTTAAPDKDADADAATQRAMLTRISELATKNLQLSGSIEQLRHSVTLRQTETTRLLTSLEQSEADQSALQREYRSCARSNVALIQHALRRIAYCAAQIDASAGANGDGSRCGGGTTVAQLQNFRDECSREAAALLLTLEGDGSEQSQPRQTQSQPRQTQSLDALHRKDASEQLKTEEQQPRQQHQVDDSSRYAVTSKPTAAPLPPVDTNTDSEDRSAMSQVVARIDAFAGQLADMHNEMALLRQFLLQESSVSRSGMEKVVARHLRAFHDSHDDDATQLQDELDELRSELCDVLKEMHLLKERTRFLVPVGMMQQQQQSVRCGGGGSSHDTRAGSGCNDATHSPELCSTCSSARSGSGNDDYRQPRYQQQQPRRDCRHHDRVRRDDAFARASSRSSSPRRPSDNAIESLARQRVAAAATARQSSCPSPHFSSRSSSISGRLSVTRDESAEPPTEDEVERRLLEQHRLFWIKEGARDAK